MKEREYTVIEIARDPGFWVYEASELEREGHYTLFRYDAAAGLFSRATVPAGAACIHFRPMPFAEAGNVPIAGWTAVEKIGALQARPRIVR